jgi:hypothetical protein
MKPITHGLTSDYAKTGDDRALTQAQRSRLVELRQGLQTAAGVREALIERAARLTLIAEWGEEWLREKAERDGAIAAFTAPMLQRFFTASAECRRALEALGKLPAADDGGAIDLSQYRQGNTDAS